MIPLVDPATPPEEQAAGIRESELAARRSDRPAGPINKFTEPELAFGAWDRGGALKDCINRLQPRTQRILRETYLDGKSSSEVGEEIGLSAENVRQQLHRAREELRRCIEARPYRLRRKDWQNAHIDNR